MKLSDAIEAGSLLATPAQFNLFGQFEPDGPIEACTLGMGALGAGIVTIEQAQILAGDTDWEELFRESFETSMEVNFPDSSAVCKPLNHAAVGRYGYDTLISEEVADTLTVRGLIALLNDECGALPLDIAALLREFGF
jgi:hypothetical protein